MVAVPVFIATLTEERASTWFAGYDDKYFKDKGALFYYISKRWAKLLCLQYVLRHRNKFKREKTASEASKLMLEGISEE